MLPIIIAYINTNITKIIITSTLTFDTASTTDDEDAIVITTSVNATEADRPTSVSTLSDTGRTAATISIPVFVGTVVGVLTLLAVSVVIIVVSCVYIKMYKGRQNQGQVEDHGYDYVTEVGRGIDKESNPIEMKVNEAYGTPGQANNLYNPTESQDMETQYEEIR
jgi:hypothetical protein